MTAHGAQGGSVAGRKPVIPAMPEVQPPGRKPTPPANSAPKQQDDAVIPRSQPQNEKQQQVRAPEATATTATASGGGVPSKSSGAESGKKAHATGGDANGDVVGEYVLGETIGKGTFGKVRLGLHLLTGEKVAVKILEKKRIVQVADVERVAREIKILKRNRHRNVIQLYEVIDSPERIFLIMEHVDGGEMFEYIVAHHRIREPEAAFLFRQIVDGLAYLHANAVTHRDLKPENLLLQASHRSVLHQKTQQSQLAPAPLPSPLLVKIVDFGLSNMHDGGRLLRTACGSPCYAAPEMIQGRLYHGPIADMWSLGVVLFAMVCGFLPFEDSNTNLLYKKILSADYKMPSFLSPNAQDLIRHILETDPEKRYTVELIRQHAWLANVPSVETLEAETSLSIIEETNTAHHELVLSQLEELGLARDDVQAALLKKAHNRFTASYFLLDSKLQRVQKHRNHQAHRLPWVTLGDVYRAVDVHDGRYRYNLTAEQEKQIGHFARCFSDALQEFAAMDHQQPEDDEGNSLDPTTWGIEPFGNGGYTGYYYSLLGGYVQLNLFLMDPKVFQPILQRGRGSPPHFIRVLCGVNDGGHPEWLADHLRPVLNRQCQLEPLNAERLQIIRDHCALLFRCMYSISGENRFLDSAWVADHVTPY